MNITRVVKAVLAVASLTYLSTGAFAFGPIDFSSDADYSNNNPPTSGLFRDIGPTNSWPLINRGFDLGPTGHTALNFVTQGNGPAGGTKEVTLYDTDPTTTNADSVFSGNFSLSADVLFKEFDNSKAGGFVFFYNEGPSGTNGLALMLWDAGNTDSDKVQIESVSSSVSSMVKNNMLPGTIDEVKWYRLTLDINVSGGTFDLTAKVFNHTDVTDPGSSLSNQIGNTMFYTNTFAALNIQSSGEIGLAMRELNHDAPNTNMVSITNFSEVPEPTSLSLLGIALGMGGLLTVVSRRKRA